MKQRQHYDELTAMSGIAILFVLFIHGCASALTHFYPGSGSYAGTGTWLRTLSGLVAPAVPMFLFISGFKYSANDTQTPYYLFLRKRLPRVLMSFAVINTVYWVLDSIRYMESFDVILLVKTYLHSWVGYSVAYQLWYIPMYCFVVALCPLVRRIMPSTAVRFCVFSIIGIVQRVLEADFTILAAYPIRFISYPAFFELGVLAHERNWHRNVPAMVGILAGGAYVLMLFGLSTLFPAGSANALVKYVLFYFAGTAIMYMLSVSLKNSSFLRWLGTVSYPVFLLHEPLIGQSISAVMSRWSIRFELSWALIWTTLVLLLAVSAMYFLEKIHLDKLLWRFRL